jgi:hypothetical protein
MYGSGIRICVLGYPGRRQVLLTLAEMEAGAPVVGFGV